MVFQDGALFPHLTVERNVAFGHPRPGRAHECLELVGLADRARSYPHELSGGERQRVALARALATDPAVVLLDEPFAALDAGLRVALREEVAGILRTAGASALLVTHDQDEALSLADRVVIVRAGRIAQVGPPEDVYRHPADRWVAEFLGAAVVLAGTVGDGVVDTELGPLPHESGARGEVEVLVRPEVIAVGPPDGPGTPARVVARSFHGHDQLLTLRLESGEQVRSRAPGAGPWRPGDAVRLCVRGPVHVLAPAPDR
jgi:iron(III) transport system ATP-binding protein